MLSGTVSLDIGPTPADTGCCWATTLLPRAWRHFALVCRRLRAFDADARPSAHHQNRSGSANGSSWWTPDAAAVTYPVFRWNGQATNSRGAARLQVAGLSLNSDRGYEQVPVGSETVDHAVVSIALAEHALDTLRQAVRPAHRCVRDSAGGAGRHPG